jgi:undecaprenyl-diphosphatase
MTPWLALVAVLLGLVEGITEFIPVSSTGHLIVAGKLLGFTGERASVFEVVIQLGAILAIVWLYRQRFVRLASALSGDMPSRRLIVNLAVAFLPAAVVGLLFHDFIKAKLFSETVVAATLLTGGVVILAVERFHPKMTIPEVDDIPVVTAFGIGLAQCLALVPGTSRSAATILGAYALGCSRLAATEFSFFLAVPVMFAATGLDLYKARHILSAADLPFFGLGFAAAFVSALVVVRVFTRFIARHNFTGFALYRIVAGIALLVWLSRVGA